MVVCEAIGSKFVNHYSDEGYYIRQNETGNAYENAVDIVPCRYTYTETDDKIPERELTAEEALALIQGADYDGGVV